MGLVERYKSEIKKLCEKYKVKSLYSFGSVNTSQFTQSSDVDLLIELSTEDPIEYTENYFNFKFQLESIFDRPVDLLESKAIKNPFLKESIDRTKVLVYGQ